MTCNRLISALLLFLLLAGGRIGLAANDAPRPHLSVPPVSVQPKMTADPADEAWERAAVIPALSVSLEPVTAGQAPLPTQVKLLWKSDTLYIRFVCVATEVYSPYTRHDDPLYKGDVAEVFLDAIGDGRQWIELEVSPQNVVFDQLATLTSEPHSTPDLVLDSEVIDRDWWPDLSWSLEGIRTAASIQHQNGQVCGWTVDIALPAKVILRRLGESRFRPMTLRANFLRYDYPATGQARNPRGFLAMNWAPVLNGRPHISPRAMGYLTLAAPHAATGVSISR